jgi:hypothetical protein
LVSIVEEAGWASGLMWMSMESLAPSEFEPQTIQLGQLHYPSHIMMDRQDIHF